jgi:hypothetical protein
MEETNLAKESKRFSRDIQRNEDIEDVMAKVA